MAKTLVHAAVVSLNFNKCLSKTTAANNSNQNMATLFSKSLFDQFPN